MQVTIIQIVTGAFGIVTIELLKGLEDLEVGRTSGDHIENGQNTEKSHRDLRRHAVTQTPVKDHYFYYFYTLRVSHTSVTWWSFTGVWMTKVSSSLQDSSQYSDQYQQCCSLDFLHSSFYFQVLQLFLPILWWLY